MVNCGGGLIFRYPLFHAGFVSSGPPGTFFEMMVKTPDGFLERRFPAEYAQTLSHISDLVSSLT